MRNQDIVYEEKLNYKPQRKKLYSSDEDESSLTDSEGMFSHLMKDPYDTPEARTNL